METGKPKVIVFNSLKGGVSKTTTSILLTNYLASAGKRVCVIDMDTNNSTSFYHLTNEQEAEKEQKNIALGLQSSDLSKFIIQTKKENISIIPSHLGLFDLRSMHSGKLKKLIATLEGFDAIIIDSQPDYNNIVMNAINAADVVITPTMLSQFDFNTAGFMQGKLLEETDKYDAWKMLFIGYTPRYETCKKSSQSEYIELFKEHFGEDKFFKSALPWISAARRYIDRDEKISRDKKETGSLWSAIDSLARELFNEEYNVEVF